MPGRLLAMDSGIATGSIDGHPTREPAFGLEAWWIDPGLKQRAETMNYTVVDPTSVLATHLTEIVKMHSGELLTREEINNLIAQLKGSVHALRAAVDNLVSNWAYMVMTGLAWSLKAWFAMSVPVHPSHKERHREQKCRLLRMEFKRFVNAIILMPCQIVRGGNRLVYRLLSWNEWQGVFLRVVFALRC